METFSRRRITKKKKTITVLGINNNNMRKRRRTVFRKIKIFQRIIQQSNARVHFWIRKNIQKKKIKIKVKGEIPHGNSWFALYTVRVRGRNTVRENVFFAPISCLTILFDLLFDNIILVVKFNEYPRLCGPLTGESPANSIEMFQYIFPGVCQLSCTRFWHP